MERFNSSCVFFFTCEIVGQRHQVVPTVFHNEHGIDVTVSLFLQAAYPWTKTATVLENQQQGRHDNKIQHVVQPQILAVNSVN